MGTLEDLANETWVTLVGETSVLKMLKEWKSIQSRWDQYEVGRRVL
jgi:hypothetical protein